MKKNSLTTAVIAGIACVAGFAGLANAVHLNPDGIGQVLLYPYYTVNNGQQTVLSATNTDQVAKAVKVRFLEGYNSREVLDFNLFLSRYDVWTATIFALRDDNKPGDDAAAAMRDRSLIAPLFCADNTIALTVGLPIIDRAQNDHFETISMADLGSLIAGWQAPFAVKRTPAYRFG